MSNLEFIIRRICDRRAAELVKLESVAFNARITFGLATNTYLLATVANVFYYIDSLMLWNNNSTGFPELVFTANSGQGSAGDIDPRTSAGTFPLVYASVETNDLRYRTGTHTAGSFYLTGVVFKVTYA